MARRARSLSRLGMVTAVILGTVSVTAGWSWGALLFAFFFSGSGWSRFRREDKTALAGARVAKGDARDSRQVLANGGLFGVAALLSFVSPWQGWLAIGLGALAAATADTWATELGMLDAGPPRLITTWRTVPPGTSGAVSRRGLLAAAAGSAFIALLAATFRWPPWVVSGAVVGGLVGVLGDSVLGALWQERRWCPRCQAGTERAVHVCGTRTGHSGGKAWLDNDGVNLLCTVIGAIVALAFAAW